MVPCLLSSRALRDKLLSTLTQCLHDHDVHIENITTNNNQTIAMILSHKQDQTKLKQCIHHINQTFQDILTLPKNKDETNKILNLFKNKQTFYITTAINYANGAPHMGHAYEAIAADVVARYNRAAGRRVYFLTGSDEHGQKIANVSEEKGITPIELCNACVAQFKDLNARLLISNDGYVRTTDAKHKAACQQYWQQSVDSGDIYLGTYEGWYNVREETFVPETDAMRDNYLDPGTGKPLQKMSEASYFFRMSKYTNALEEHIVSHPDFIRPDSRRNEVLERVRDGLQDLSISRTTFSWGIPVPQDPKHVMYVWFDALTNYLSGIDFPDGSNACFWPANVHLIGKDIIWFHCAIWPAILMSIGVPLPESVVAHGFILGPDGRKMSKTFNNVVSPDDVLSRHSVDAFRYFLMREAQFGDDLVFSEDALALRHNADLCDTLGNLLHRSLSLCTQYCGGSIPVCDANVIIDVGAIYRSMEEAMHKMTLMTAFDGVMSALSDANKYVQEVSPWHLPKDDPRRLVVVRTLLEVLYVAAHFLQPVLVQGTARIFESLATPPVPLTHLSDRLDNLEPGTQISKGEILYQKAETPDMKIKMEKDAEAKRLQKQKVEEAARRKAAASKAAAAGNADDPAADLYKFDFRVGLVTECKRHPDADSLFVESVDIGEAAPRQVVSGLANYMQESQLVNSRVVVLANIKPSKMRGVESHAMLLCAAAADEPKMEILRPPQEAVIGERVIFEGHTDEPERQLNPKKKMWEKIQPKLNTSEECIARFGELPFLTSAGPCRSATIANGSIK